MKHGLQSRKRIQYVHRASPAAARFMRTAGFPHRTEHAELGLWPALPYMHLHSTFLKYFALNKQQKGRKFVFLVSGMMFITTSMYIIFFLNMYMDAAHLHTHTQINCSRYIYKKSHIPICKRNTLQWYPISFAIHCIMQIYSGWGVVVNWKPFQLTFG